MCQGNNYQFDTLRRAKHSSMMILWHLHNPSIPAYAHTCNACESDIGCGTRWHCETCYDFDICDACRTAGSKHDHPLIPLRDTQVTVTVDATTDLSGLNSTAAPPSLTTTANHNHSGLPPLAPRGRGRPHADSSAAEMIASR
jgi:hypothetical protein